MELNRDQIIRALECCKTPLASDCENCSYTGKRLEDGVYEGCVNCLVGDALALIKELTEDVERVVKQCAEIIVECDERDAERLKEVADLKAITEQYQKQFEDCYEENERLHASCTELEQACKKWQGQLNIECEYTRADTVRKMQERLKALLKTDYINGTREHAISVIDQIAKEMLEGEL